MKLETGERILMKRIIILALLLACCSCKTYNMYLISGKPNKIYSAPAKLRTENKFSAPFSKADSLFQKASNEAAKAAYEKTKHLIPN